MIGSFKEMDKKRQAFDAERPAPTFTHPVFKSSLLPLFGSIMSGVFLALAFPGFGKTTLVFAALVPLMFAVQSASAKKAAGLGLLCGFVFFIMSLGWLRNLTGMVEGAGLKASALLGYVVLALYCALYVVPFTLAVAFGVKQWAGSNLWKNLRFMFAVSMVWTGAEYLRGLLFTGFPWNPLGVTQYANTTIIQLAEWGGVHLISAFIVWMNAAVFITLRQYTHGSRMKRYRPHFELMLGIAPLALSIAYGMNVLFNVPEYYDSVNVALIQPNIEQTEKWDAAKDREILDTLEELTSAAVRLGTTDLVIWPETALPDPVRLSRSCSALVERMSSHGIPLLAGSMDFDTSGAAPVWYNSSILFGTNGTFLATYNKQHLVPFGEYVPFPSFMRKFTPIEMDFGMGDESTVMPLRGEASFSVLICFEDTVAPLAVKAVRAGARWLVSQSNDAWFDPSAQSEQHLAHAVFRCVENRIPMARCCNTGVSCTIDAYGSMQRNLAVRTKGFTVGALQPRPVGLEQTFYTRSGNAFAKVALLAGATVLFVLRSLNRKKRKKNVQDAE
ncbi:apolipoprotein N-acyltransferase [Pontiella sulfatireligans]|uniref:Apolipoprotein N-acyltransferase n=1 Tax=Pontiella sulfatireligans TaxID=2750658 RepID=A0A6C2UQL7_9BACT|nr:apolipoprotein N-acyltransferase [Pontiella sulfatireligans]VGO21594.1 Apolipoprotein N-acyltransferase [Pontiella sulfatireligans]